MMSLAPRSLERGLARHADTAVLPAYVQADEVHAMQLAATRPRDRALLLALWSTGGRVSEVLALRRCDLDPAGRSVRLVNLKQHKRAEKTCYLSSAVVIELLAYCEISNLRGTAYLFPAKHSGRPISREMAWRIVGTLAVRAGIERRITVHMFRHGHAVHLLRGGVPLPAVKDQLGHASILTTMAYLKLTASDKRAMIGAVEF